MAIYNPESNQHSDGSDSAVEIPSKDVRTINNNIQEDYVSFENAKLLKEKGFIGNKKILDWYKENGELADTFDFINQHTTAKDYYKFSGWLRPTTALAIKWIRENFKIHIVIDGADNYKYQYQILTWSWYEIEKTFRLGHTVLGDTFWDISSENFNSPEEAENAAIIYTLKNLI